MMCRYLPIAEHLSWSSLTLLKTRRTSQVPGRPFLKGSLLPTATNLDDDSERSCALALDFLHKEVKCHWDGSTAIITYLGNTCHAGWW